MGGCAAINCSNHSRKGKRMVRFPKDEQRRRIWIINCRRSNWEPTSQTQLCIDHFEDSQFETFSLGEKRRKLRRTAVPTLFDFSPPVTEKKKELKPYSVLNISHQTDSEVERSTAEESVNKTILYHQVLLKKIEDLEKENASLKERIKENDMKLASFLTKEQIAAITRDGEYSICLIKKSSKSRSPET